MVKEVLRNSGKAFPKVTRTYFFGKMFADGLATTESDKWTRQRKEWLSCLNGNLIPSIAASVESMLQKWKEKTNSGLAWTMLLLAIHRLATQSKNRGDGAALNLTLGQPTTLPPLTPLYGNVIRGRIFEEYDDDNAPKVSHQMKMN
ncbi:hypothetical protein F3Y22_tig00001674pilonHSYRG00001 [Hibiscus syriacus]|uniref:Uncharacterized protein n=1 Tax=Hibiscus syriacus TaxID=106335 RepID=A0A6A3CUC1_HIBSY|nr:hypothetical protein F3Y22_tig00001674pilonHSYRG00001 [Hibiscus syriacus]